MRELTGDIFYKALREYDRCVIDYCLIESDSVYCGCRSHWEAIRFSMDKVWERYRQDLLLDTDEEPLPWTQDPEKAKAEQIDPKGFLTAPDVLKKSPAEGQIPYWYAFLCAPHGTGYDPQDLKKINEKLFPKGAERSGGKTSVRASFFYRPEGL